MSVTQQPFLRAVNLSKRYGAVEALQQVSLNIYPGEIIGVVGDTDSGKSTLLRLVAGGAAPDSGQFYVNGRRASLFPSHRAVRYGIKAVHQDIHIAKHMNALGYVFAGQPPRQGPVFRVLGWWNQRQMRTAAAAQFERLGFEPVPLDCPMDDLTNTQRRMVGFVYATILSPQLLLLDEPMNAVEAYRANILDLIQGLRRQNGSVLLVTQNLDDIFQLSDRIIVLSAGRKIAERCTTDTSEEEVVRLILGSVESRLTPAVWALSNYFEVRRQAEKLDWLNKALEHRAVQLQALADVAQSATSILDRDKLLVQAVQIIQQRFGYYYVGIYLVDPSNSVVRLRSSASREGYPPQPGEIELAVSEHDGGMIGWCAATGRSHLANDVSQDQLFEPEAKLPYARSECVLPLRIGRRILGVLDLQSDTVGTFNEQDELVLQSLADQLSIAIRNADLFEAAQIARQQADEANRYKSVFLSNMSHELRTPLSAIIGHTQAMLDIHADYYSVTLPDEYRHDLNTIRTSGEHLLALINDILDLNKIEVGELKLNRTVADLSHILNDALYTTSGLIHGKPIELFREYTDSLPPVWVDKVRTRQVILNLLSNAAKFTEQGSITVTTEVRDEDIVVAVIDTGIGIPPHIQSIIFDRFRQGDPAAARKYGGTGLGLNISRQLVTMQGGRIWVESKMGEGSTFRFTVPRATPAQLAVHGGAGFASPPLDNQRSVVFEAGPETWQRSNIRLILLAWHTTSGPASFQSVLEKAGYAVEPTPVDTAVIEMAEVMLPDLIIFDAAEPASYEVLCALLAAPEPAQAIPVIALAGSPVPVACEAAASARDASVVWLPKAEALPPRMLHMVRACFENDG